MTDETTRLRPDDVIPPEGDTTIQGRKLIEDAVLMIPNIIKLIGRLLTDSRVPRRSKIALGMAAAYVVSPIDLIPDVIPVIGWADDVLILMFALDSLIDRAGPEIVEEHWDGPGDLLSLIRDAIGVSRSILPKRLSQTFDRLSG
jgi:uncharacterized membrane protein YkvA (DUF1232 family)